VNTFDDFLAGRIGIRCDTKEEYNKLMRICEGIGLYWGWHAKPTSIDHFVPGRTFAVDGDHLAYCSNIECSNGDIKSAYCPGPCPHRNNVPFSAICAEPEKPAPKPATPYDGRGQHTVGDLFEVVLGDAFNPGDIVRLIYDDKSEFPEFERVSDGKQQFYFWYKVKPITPAARKIVITADGRVTTARLIVGKRTIKTATATCSPSDEFSFETGTRLAFIRLIRPAHFDFVHERIADLREAIDKLDDEIKAVT
jgi:hypothetical protein